MWKGKNSKAMINCVKGRAYIKEHHKDNVDPISGAIYRERGDLSFTTDLWSIQPDLKKNSIPCASRGGSQRFAPQILHILY